MWKCFFRCENVFSKFQHCSLFTVGVTVEKLDASIYKTPFHKSGHICMCTLVISAWLTMQVAMPLMLNVPLIQQNYGSNLTYECLASNPKLSTYNSYNFITVVVKTMSNFMTDHCSNCSIEKKSNEPIVTLISWWLITYGGQLTAKNGTLIIPANIPVQWCRSSLIAYRIIILLIWLNWEL